MKLKNILFTMAAVVASATPLLAATYWVPIAAHTDGVAGSSWRTDLTIINSCSVPVPVEVRVHAAEGTATKSFIVAGNAQRLFADIVGTIAPSRGIGALEVRVDGAAAIESRTYNAAAAGSPRQAIPTITVDDAFDAGERAVLPLLDQDSTSRTNVGVLNMGADVAEVSVELRDREGVLAGEYVLTIPSGQVILDGGPYALRFGRADITSGYAVVKVNSGSAVYPFASVIANTSGVALSVLPKLVEACPATSSKVLDPTFIPQFAEPLIVPPVMTPASDTATRTDYAISVAEFQQQVLPEGFPKTTVWGYGRTGDPLPGSGAPSSFHFPAFTIEATVGKPVRVTWTNRLVDANNHFLQHRLPVDPTLHWANPPGPADTPGDAPFRAYNGPVPIVTHLHGGHVADHSDGGPTSWFLPDAGDIPTSYVRQGTKYASVEPAPPGSAIYEYPNDQLATTLWYHDHALGLTRLNVYMGLAGFYLLRDAAETALDLPGPAPARGDAAGQRYYEIPVAIQDRSFHTDGSLAYPASRAEFDGFEGPFVPETSVHPIWNPEFFGNTIVVNGRAWPFLDVEPRRYRLRLLNGCNGRFLLLKFGRDGLEFHQIGSDGGLLSGAPLTRESILLSPAQRADVIVDFSQFAPGDEITLLNLGPDEPFQGMTGFDPADPSTTGRVMRFRIVARTQQGRAGSIPAALPAVLPLTTTLPPRDLTLNELIYEPADIPSEALLGTAADGALEWHMDTTEKPLRGSTEVWRLLNLTADAHPVHLHLVMFQVLDRTPFDAEEYAEAQRQWLAFHRCGVQPRPEDFVTGPAAPREAWESGWMDTVVANPGEITRIVANFDIAGQYLWHCHILEHEDNEMMRVFEVVP